MKLLNPGAFLLLTAMLMAQQQLPPYSPPPHNTPPSLPGEENPSQPMPPDTKAPPPQALSSSDVQAQIDKKLTTEPLLANTSVDGTVDDNSVVLTGRVDNERQHDLALRIAESYAGDRRIIDKIQIQART